MTNSQAVLGCIIYDIETQPFYWWQPVFQCNPSAVAYMATGGTDFFVAF